MHPALNHLCFLGRLQLLIVCPDCFLLVLGLRQISSTVVPLSACFRRTRSELRLLYGNGPPWA